MTHGDGIGTGFQPAVLGYFVIIPRLRPGLLKQEFLLLLASSQVYFVNPQSSVVILENLQTRQKLFGCMLCDEVDSEPAFA